MANKQIKDFDLKESIDGLEDLLIQDSNGITKRIKTSKLMGNLDLSNYYTKAEVDDLLENTGLSIDMADYYDKATIDNLLAKKANVSHAHSYNDLTDKPSIPSIDGLATKKELTDGLATKANVSHTHDQYLTEHQDLSDYALKTELPTVPTKVSELANDSGFIKSIPSEYITETELSAKSYATETYVQNKIAEAALSGGEVDLSSYATKTELATKADKTAIPTKTSQLTNDSGFLTSHQNISSKADKTYVDNQLATKSNTDHTHSYNDLTDKPTIPSTTNLATKKELTDGLATKSDKVHTHDQYLTEHQDISNLALKSEIPDVSSFITSEDLPTVPTKVSELTNDKNYITSIPSEYITETELKAKGYLTSHQDISGLQTKTDNNLTTTSKEVVGAINEVKDMADLILDTEVRLDKTYSSSKIYSAIQDAIDSSKSFTLDEIGKMSGASYKVVTSTAEMTDGKIIYLLENGATYDMYIVEEADTVTKIGDTAIDLSSYLKTTDAESTYLKKTDATTTYTTQTSFNNHINDTVAHLTQLEKNKLLTTDNITSTINNSSDNTQVPTAKATYDLANTKANTNHTHNTSDIKGLSIPTKVSQLTNDSGYLSSVPSEYVTETELTAKKYLTSVPSTYALKTDIPTVPTKTSQLTNDSGFIKSIPSEYITETELNAKGYLTNDKFEEANVYKGKYVGDLNDIPFIKSGVVYKYDIRSGNCTNTPVGTHGILYSTYFDSDNYCLQEFHSLQTNTAGIYRRDKGTGVWSGWRRVCTTTVEDVPNTIIVSENPKVKLNSNCYYTVINGVCYVTLWGFICTEVGQQVINSSMPKTKLNMQGLCTHGSSGDEGGCVFILYDGNGNNKLSTEVKTTNEPLYGSFSYPVAES